MQCSHPPSCPNRPIGVEIWVPSIARAKASESELAEIHGPKRGAPLSTQTTPVKSSVNPKKARTEQVGVWRSHIFILFNYIHVCCMYTVYKRPEGIKVTTYEYCGGKPVSDRFRI